MSSKAASTPGSSGSMSGTARSSSVASRSKGEAIATLDELAVELGLTRERVRQMQLEALKQLRQALASEHVGRDAVL